MGNYSFSRLSKLASDLKGKSEDRLSYREHVWFCSDHTLHNKLCFCKRQHPEVIEVSMLLLCLSTEATRVVCT